MKPVRLAPDAVSELGEAAAWYESREPGLASRFIEEVEQVLPTIGARPRSFARLLDTAADLIVGRFPVAHDRQTASMPAPHSSQSSGSAGFSNPQAAQVMPRAPSPAAPHARWHRSP